MTFILRPTVADQDPSTAYRILLVDGDVEIQAALMVLLKADFLVSTASTVSEGFYFLNTFSPHLVILDLSSPHLEGVYFLQTLRFRIPMCLVIVLTTSEHSAMLREIATQGIDGFYQKPLHIDKLLEQINVLFAPLGQSLSFTPGANHSTSKAIAYVCHNYTQPLTVEVIAKAIGVSSSHLAHLFRVATGMTVKQYLTEVRIEVAKRLLTNTPNTLDSIAENIGFCDASHFSRVFQRYVGCWPGKYRHQATLPPKLPKYKRDLQERGIEFLWLGSERAVEVRP